MESKVTANKMEEDYEPNESEEYMCDQHIAYFKKRLLDWRNEIIQGMRSNLEEITESTSHSSDINDLASDEESQYSEIATQERYVKLLKQIEEALNRIEEGEYGYCEETGEKIGIKRLIARPVATLCIEAQEKFEMFLKQHAIDDD